MHLSLGDVGLAFSKAVLPGAALAGRGNPSMAYEPETGWHAQAAAKFALPMMVDLTASRAWLRF